MPAKKQEVQLAGGKAIIETRRIVTFRVRLGFC